MDFEPKDSISGIIRSRIYGNDESGYAVLRVETDDGSEITVVGCIPFAAPGESLQAEGNWVTHPLYGEQFRTDRTFRALPDSPRELFDYLASGTVPGVGEATARRLVDTFGMEALDILEFSPEKLTEIKGITSKRAQDIGMRFRVRLGLRRLVEYLADYQVSPGIAARLYRIYGAAALDMLSKNPYILADEQFGLPFELCDRMALSGGMHAESPVRMEAAVKHTLLYNTQLGHVFLPEDRLCDAAAQMLQLQPDDMAKALDRLCAAGETVRDRIAGIEVCYLASYYEAETYVAGRIDELCRSSALPHRQAENAAAAAELTCGIKYSELQRQAIVSAAENRIFLLTGGPGTGKTTAVSGMLAIFDRMGIDTGLVAPTGRAAKRLSELTSRPAATIHRLLGMGRGQDGVLRFAKNESDPLKLDAIILDETSMVDIQLMASLLKAMRPDCRLILVGDADQLPSVGAGNLLGDLIRSGRLPHVELTQIFRQAEKSGIITGAHAVNSGKMPDLSNKAADIFFLRRRSESEIVDTVVELCLSRLPSKMGIPPSSIQVLSPTRKGEAGTENLNRRLQHALNPPHEQKPERSMPGFKIRKGDRIMQIKNDYDVIWQTVEGQYGAGMFNGDVGIVEDIEPRTDISRLKFDDRTADYSPDMMLEIEPAYAITVHKSQGSEYPAVILVAHRAPARLMSRQILYTAMTRARQLLVIVGDENCIAAMVANDKVSRRYSGLKTRLVKAGENEN